MISMISCLSFLIFRIELSHEYLHRVLGEIASLILSEAIFKLLQGTKFKMVGSCQMTKTTIIIAKAEMQYNTTERLFNGACFT